MKSIIQSISRGIPRILLLAQGHPHRAPSTAFMHKHSKGRRKGHRSGRGLGGRYVGQVLVTGTWGRHLWQVLVGSGAARLVSVLLMPASSAIAMTMH